jgi:hypothetical protein
LDIARGPKSASGGSPQALARGKIILFTARIGNRYFVSPDAGKRLQLEIQTVAAIEEARQSRSSRFWPN